ncbi:MAG: hypothetical protein WAM91_01535 [Candidatus Acidiferrales bacterium]
MISLPRLRRIGQSLFCLPVVLFLLCLLAPITQAQSLPLYAVSSNDNELWTVDPLTGQALTGVTITLAGFTVNFANGLAQNPTNGQLFAILSVQGGTGRELATIVPGTGVATLVGNTGDNFAGITFAPDGTLYGVTGDGATNPSTLYTLNTTTGAPTFVKALGSFGPNCNGEAIAFNPVDGLIYHSSGLPGCQVFETINPSTLVSTPITLSGDALPEPLALVHWSGNFFLYSSFSQLYVISNIGQARIVSNTAVDADYKGFVFAGSAPACPPNAALYGAASGGITTPSLFYSINPATGAPTLIGPIGFEGVDAMKFTNSGTLFGAGRLQDGSITPVLLTINPCTGVGTEVGPTGIIADDFSVITDLAIRRTDGVMFGFLSDLSTITGLAEINSGTGAHTLAKTYSFQPGGGLVFSATNVLLNAYGSNLESLNTATGAMTAVTAIAFPGSISADSPSITSLDFQQGSGILFGVVGATIPVGAPGKISGAAPAPPIPNANYLATIDPVAGTVTLVGSGPTQTGLNAIAFTQVISSPTSFAATGGTPQSAVVNTIFSAALQATVTDINGHGVPNVTIIFTAPATGPSITFAGGFNTATTNSNGVATLGSISANTIAGGPYIVTAAFLETAPNGGTDGFPTLPPITFSLTNTPGTAVSIVSTSGTPQSAQVTTGFALPFAAKVTDQFSNVVPGVTITFTAPATGASGTFGSAPVATAMTNASGIVTSPTFTANATSGGPYNVVASLPSEESPVRAGFPTTANYSLKNLDYSVSPVTGSETVTAGGTANYTINFVAIVGNTANSTAFSCTGLPTLSSCLFTPATLPANSGNTSIALGISTTSRVKTTNIGIGGRFNQPLLRILRPGVLVSFVMLAMLLTLFFAQSQKIRRLPLSAISFICVLVLFAGCLVGCGSMSTGFPLIQTQPGTPAGSYPVTVNATSDGVTRTTTITLVVQ